MQATCFGSESERAAPSARGADVVGSTRPYPVCGAPMTGRKTSACSDKRRAAKSRQGRIPLPVAEAEAIRARLTAALEAAWEVKTTLERNGI